MHLDEWHILSLTFCKLTTQMLATDETSIDQLFGAIGADLQGF